MGTFIGHLVPGSILIGFASWWLYNVLYRYFYARRFRSTSYKNTSTFPCCSCAGNLPIESIIKVVYVGIGIFGEVYTAFDHGTLVHWGNLQHATMFSFFGINGLVELCLHYKLAVPPTLDYVTAALAFGVEGFLFYYHLHGRPHMDVMIHMFLFYTIVSCVISTVAEMYQPTNVIPALCRVFFTTLHGTWLIQAGFILFPQFGEKWNSKDHTQMMLVTMIFAWHIAAILAAMFGIGALIWFRVQNGASQKEACDEGDSLPPNSPHALQSSP